MNLCAHGYLPEEISRSLLTMLYSPMQYRVTTRPDKDNRVTKLTAQGSLVKNTTSQYKYVMNIKLVGSSPAKSIKTEVSWFGQESRLKVNINPSHFDLLRLNRVCIDEQFKTDNYSLRISVHPECTIEHVKVCSLLLSIYRLK